MLKGASVRLLTVVESLDALLEAREVLPRAVPVKRAMNRRIGQLLAPPSEYRVCSLVHSPVHSDEVDLAAELVALINKALEPVGVPADLRRDELGAFLGVGLNLLHINLGGVLGVHVGLTRLVGLAVRGGQGRESGGQRYVSPDSTKETHLNARM